MKLRLDRLTSNGKNSLSLLFADSDFFAFVPEDGFHFLDEKVNGETRIPVGTYNIDLTFSPRFKKNMWEILNVPGFSGIRIHPGDSALDTEGCIMPGFAVSFNEDELTHTSRSQEACGKLYTMLQNAKDAGEKITIVVSDEILERPDL